MNKLNPTDRFKAMLEEAEQNDSFHFDAAKVELAEKIFTAMEDAGMSGAGLARQLGVSRAYVNKVLHGTANLTIESLVKIGRALGREFRFELVTPTRSDRSSDTRIVYKTTGEMNNVLVERPPNVLPFDPKKLKKGAVIVTTKFEMPLSEEKEPNASLQVAA